MKVPSICVCDKTECILIWVLLVASISLIGGGSACLYTSDKNNFECSIILGTGLSILVVIIALCFFFISIEWLDKQDVIVNSPISSV
jgi:hypothetical protein